MSSIDSSSPRCQTPNDSPRSALRSTATIAASAGEEFRNGGIVEAAEATAAVATGERGDLELGHRELAVWAGQRSRPHPHRCGSVPTSATRISTSIGFISWVKMLPRIWAYWLASVRASTSSREYW